MSPSLNLHHRDFHAQRVIDAGHFQSDDSAADDQQAIAIERQLQCAARIDDARIIGQSGQHGRFRSRGDDTLLEVHAARAVIAFDIERMRSDELCLALNERDLALFGQQHQTVGQTGDHLAFPNPQTVAVDLRRTEDDAVGCHVGRLFDDFGGVQQRLGRYAAVIQANAPEHRPTLDQGHFEP